MSKKPLAQSPNIILVLLPLTFTSIAFLLIRMWLTGSLIFWFMAWNLLLAWIPLEIIIWLKNRLKSQPWLTVPNLLISLAWLLFLPNSFYVMTDIIHLQSRGDISIMYDAVMLLSFVLCGLILGYINLYMMHKMLMERMSQKRSHMAIAGVLLLCSFAIYLGRYLRWNTWDVLVSPAGLLFDVSERFINPVIHAQTYALTTVFFVFLGTLYLFVYGLMQRLEGKSKTQ